MPTDGIASPIDRAWGYIPQGATAAGAGRGTFTRRRIDRIAAIAAGVGCFVLGAQAFVIALSDDDGIREPWGPVVLGVVFGALALMCIACFFERTAKPATGAFAIIYVLVLLLWPALTVGSVAQVTPEPWLWYLVNVATMAAVIAFPLPLQIAWTVATPLLYGVIRLAQGGFATEFWAAFVFEVPYSLILGSLLLVLAVIFRRMGSGVDRARASAVSAYAKAAEAQAAHEERVAVSALMHDSVLAALIAAERADSERERELAVGMAREALTRLANTEDSVAREGSDAPIAWEQIVVELRRILSELGADAVVEVRGDSPLVPERVARAVILAARQAGHNAMEHARGRGLHVLAQGVGEEGFTIVVSDSGPGFDPQNIPEDRLGLRASVVARMAAVAGEAQIVSDASGTVVTLTWPRA